MKQIFLAHLYGPCQEVRAVLSINAHLCRDSLSRI